MEPDEGVTELERRFMANQDLQAQLTYGRAHPEELVPYKSRRAKIDA